jgi:hypothetical protein
MTALIVSIKNRLNRHLNFSFFNSSVGFREEVLSCIDTGDVSPMNVTAAAAAAVAAITLASCHRQKCKYTTKCISCTFQKC